MTTPGSGTEAEVGKAKDRNMQRIRFLELAGAPTAPLVLATLTLLLSAGLPGSAGGAQPTTPRGLGRVRRPAPRPYEFAHTTRRPTGVGRQIARGGQFATRARGAGAFWAVFRCVGDRAEASLHIQRRQRHQFAPYVATVSAPSPMTPLATSTE